MKRWRWVTSVAVAVLSLAAGVAIAGRPEVPVDYVMAEPRSAQVVVASASGNSEAAQRAAEALRAAGWSRVEVRTALNEPGAESQVYATSDRFAEATQLALQLQLQSTEVRPLPGNQLTTPSDVNDEIIIIVGDDISR